MGKIVALAKHFDILLPTEKEFSYNTVNKIHFLLHMSIIFFVIYLFL
jgi:hypothetical protein